MLETGSKEEMEAWWQALSVFVEFADCLHQGKLIQQYQADAAAAASTASTPAVQSGGQGIAANSAVRKASPPGSPALANRGGGASPDPEAASRPAEAMSVRVSRASKGAGRPSGVGTPSPEGRAPGVKAYQSSATTAMLRKHKRSVHKR